MSTTVHSSAIIEERAQLGECVIVDADAYVGKLVSLGKGTSVYHHATIDGRSRIGEYNVIHP
jgi:UDP-N-acetylglucosamine acyltransferase